ncbi:unnamed protein product [Rotaria sp. Silwood1]|nr:unnamed protein product [Rotaria sp. Silwood1]
MHQICSSSFVETAWINSIYNDNNRSYYTENHFRLNAVVYFLGLRSLCIMADRYVQVTFEALRNIKRTRWSVVSKEHLHWTVQGETQQQKERYKGLYSIMLLYIRHTVQINQLMNIFSSNWFYLLEDNETTSNYRIPTKPVSFGSNCSCAVSMECTDPVFIDGQPVPGFVFGCHPMESVLRSTLICLYSQTCVDRINTANILSVHPLDRSLPSQFAINSTVEEMAMNLFVEQWLVNVSYSRFFSACRPSACTYSVSQRKQILQVVTIVLGLYGGTTMILGGTSRILVTAFYRILALIRRRNTIVIPFA